MNILLDARVDAEDGIGRYTRNLIISLSKIVSGEMNVVSRRILLQKLVNKVFIDDSKHYTRSELSCLTDAINSFKPDVLHCTDYRVPLLRSSIPLVVSIHDIFRYTEPDLCYDNNSFITRYGYEIFMDMQNVTKLIVEQIEQENQRKEFLNYEAFNYSWSNTSMHRNYYISMLTWALNCASVVLVPTLHVHNEITSNFKMNKPILIIPYGINHADAKILPPPENKSSAPSTPYFLYVGQTRKHKNVNTLLNAFTIIATKDKKVQLVIVGRDGPSFEKTLTQNLDRQINSRIHWVGYVNDDDLKLFYQNAISLVHLASYEGFGFVPLEALSNGTQVIASNIDVLHETLSDDAFYIDQEHPEEIANAMEVILTNRLGKLTKNESYVNKFIKKFDWDITAKQTYHSYQIALEQI